MSTGSAAPGIIMHNQFYDFQGMEKTVRDQVGVQDFVLLEDYTNVDAFLANLRKRAEADSIYVSDGEINIVAKGNVFKSLFELINFVRVSRPTLAKF